MVWLPGKIPQNIDLGWLSISLCAHIHNKLLCTLISRPWLWSSCWLLMDVALTPPGFSEQTLCWCFGLLNPGAAASWREGTLCSECFSSSCYETSWILKCSSSPYELVLYSVCVVLYNRTRWRHKLKKNITKLAWGVTMGITHSLSS